MDKFIFQFEWDAQVGYLKHEPCGELIELIDFERLDTLIKVTQIHRAECPARDH